MDRKEIDAINNADIYNTYKNLYLSQKEREEKLLQGIQSANDLTACAGAKKGNGTTLTLITKENAIENTFAIPLDFDFVKNPVYPYRLKENLIIRLELNSSEKVILCCGDSAATYKLSNISIEYDAILD